MKSCRGQGEQQEEQRSTALGRVKSSERDVSSCQSGHSDNTKFKIMTREEKKQARVERYEQLAAKAKQESNSLYEQSKKMSDAIPFGQPILVGHHSERADRRYRGRMWDKMEKSVKADEKAAYYERKAAAAENNDNIYLEDEDAVKRLTEKIESLKRGQEMMKATNKICRDKKLSNESKIDELVKLGFSEEQANEIMTPDYMGRIGFASFSLTNNNANIRRLEQQLKRAIQLRETETTETEINGVRVVMNTEENRLQLFFPGKPDEEMRSRLKQNAFRWCPSNGCWQSYLKSWQVNRAKEILQ